MTHQTLYRKYRPQTFADVVGQDHVTRTLRNAVEEGAVAHAYLFCGPRGTGKTTTARILAKALDCEKGPTPDPDDTCEACREITEGRHPDVYELDAASRTGVQDVRDEIIGKAPFAATRGPYKLYIIDEVHMLSGSAFNALLKTVEEPPSHVVFVLCTTHPHKVPDTIHSRCQRFDFRRISVDDIVERLARIAESEGISVEDGVLPLMARHAAGGMRDAIGTLDQIASFTGKNVTVADVEGLLGEVDAARLREVVGLIAGRDVAGCFGFVARLVESGHDVPEFVKGLTSYVRDLYVVSAAGDTEGLVDATDEEKALLTEQAARFDLDRLARVLDVLGELSGDLRRAPDARLALEVALTRLARPQADLTIESLSERVAALESGVRAEPAKASGRAAVRAPGSEPVERELPEKPSAPAPGPAPVEPPAEAPAAAPAAAPPAPPVLDSAALRRAWSDILRDVKSQRPAASKLFLDTEVDLDGDTLVVEFASDRRVPMKLAQEAETTAMLRKAVERATGSRLAVRYQLGRGTVKPQAADPSPAATADPPAAATADQPAGEVPDSAAMLMDALGAEVVGGESQSDGEDA